MAGARVTSAMGMIGNCLTVGVIKWPLLKIAFLIQNVLNGGYDEMQQNAEMQCSEKEWPQIKFDTE
jgi:hypothetical protein